MIYLILATTLILSAYSSDKFSNLKIETSESKKMPTPKNIIATNQIDPRDLVRGCEGEYCFCPQKGKMTTALEAYEKMDKKSPVIIKLKIGDEVETKDVHTKYVKPGRWEVQKPQDGLKKGDILTYMRFRGEGDFNAYKGSEFVKGIDDDGSVLKQIEATETETWYTISSSGKVGYILDNPLPNCDKPNYP